MCGENGRHGREGSSQNPLTCATSQRCLGCGLQQCWFDIELKSGFYVGVLTKYSMWVADKLYSHQQQQQERFVRVQGRPSVCELETV